MYCKISTPFLLLFACISILSTAQPNPDSISIPGLQQRVEVVRDRWGVNHIYAANERDLFFAQGYCAARDRLFQFDVVAVELREGAPPRVEHWPHAFDADG